MKSYRKSSPRVRTRLIPFLNPKEALPRNHQRFHKRRFSGAFLRQTKTFDQENLYDDQKELKNLCGILQKQQKELKKKLEDNKKMISLIKDRPGSQILGIRNFQQLRCPLSFDKNIKTPSFALKLPLRIELDDQDDEAFTFRDIQSGKTRKKSFDCSIRQMVNQQNF